MKRQVKYHRCHYNYYHSKYSINFFLGTSYPYYNRLFTGNYCTCRNNRDPANKKREQPLHIKIPLTQTYINRSTILIMSLVAGRQDLIYSTHKRDSQVKHIPLTTFNISLTLTARPVLNSPAAMYINKPPRA